MDKETPKRKRSRTEPTVLRQDGTVEAEIDILAELAADWAEETPARARIEDITLREEDLGISSRVSFLTVRIFFFSQF